MKEIVFLKLGGSLITDKTQPYTPRLEILENISAQIRQALNENPGISLVIGHGSGSFGHTAAKKYHTRDGLIDYSGMSSKENILLYEKYWQGFSQVWFQASTLNRFVLEALHAAGLPVLSLSPAASVISSNGKVKNWDLSPIKSALEAGLIPVVYGDVIFDTAIGGTILSTEDLFEHLAEKLNPSRILLAGIERAVWADYPECTQKIEKITPENFSKYYQSLGGSHGTDVTGGMESKVRQMLSLVKNNEKLTIQIFSGEGKDNLFKALIGEQPGTIIKNS